MSDQAPSLFFLFGTAFVVGFSGAMSPGPVLTATIAEVLKRGFRAGPLIVAGHAILEVAVMLAIVLGLGAWITQDVPRAVLGIGGGSLLVLLGTQMALTARAAVENVEKPASKQAQVHRNLVWMGMATSLSNPYWTIWWATTGLYFASMSLQRGWVGIVSFYTGHILSDLTWYSFVAAAVAAGRKIFEPHVYRWMIVICGFALVSLGAYFGAGGLGFFASR